MNVLQTSILALFIGGCATIAPPKELRDARSADKQESEGLTATLNPADLHSAKQSLATAEQSFAADGDTQNTRDLAYTAYVGFEVAASRARTIKADQEVSSTKGQMHANIAAYGERAAVGLENANQEIAAQDHAMASERQRHSASEARSADALRTEQQRRADAEERAAQSAADLARLGTVKQDARGIVLTLSGGVLFASSKSELLPSAQVKLNEVADALVKKDPDSKIVVEGFTDSQGGADYNLGLSQRRAKTVRDYLVARGVAADRITSQGYGPARPVADNSSAEGRANNRRVEIVVQPAVKH